MALSIQEDDAGTKRGMMKATEKTQKEVDEEFGAAIQEYWYAVWETARQLCLEYGAYDTGALYELSLIHI